MVDTRELLGLPLSLAQARLAQAGQTMVVVLSQSPRRREETGTLRVVRVREGQLTCCRFPDGAPKAPCGVEDKAQAGEIQTKK